MRTKAYRSRNLPPARVIMTRHAIERHEGRTGHSLPPGFEARILSAYCYPEPAGPAPAYHIVLPYDAEQCMIVAADIYAHEIVVKTLWLASPPHGNIRFVSVAEACASAVEPKRSQSVASLACEVCGARASSTTLVAGVVLSTCKRCASHGTLVTAANMAWVGGLAGILRALEEQRE